jgi:hypothetical protein
MIRNGFNRSTAGRLLHMQTEHVKIEHVQKLCLMINCTPNDLYEWRPAPGSSAADHPLETIKHGSAGATIDDFVREMPLEKLRDLESMLGQLKNA